MPTIVWLLAATGAWLAAVCAICLLMTAVKRADARLQTPPTRLVEPAAGRLSVNDASRLRAPRASAIAVGAREPPLALRLITIAAGRQRNTPPWPPLSDADLEACWSAHAYRLYVHGRPVAQLHWHVGLGCAAGWYLWRPRGGWQQLAVDRGLDADFGTAAPDPGWWETAELAAFISTALALDAAASLLHGPPTAPSRALRARNYEIHAGGLPAEVVPIAFPETTIVRTADVSTLTGHFDDLGLTVVSRRIALLGGQLLAIFDADAHVDGRPW